MKHTDTQHVRLSQTMASPTKENSVAINADHRSGYTHMITAAMNMRRLADARRFLFQK